MRRLSRCLFPAVLLLVVFLPALASGNDDPVVPDPEVDHLLEFIEHSGCTFIRNEVLYDGRRAREHLEKKYNYIKKRKKEVSAELFIKYAASQSSLSKKPYMVQCDTGTITSKSWLTDELGRYRRLPQHPVPTANTQ